MRINELHKFSDDKERAGAMIQAIDQQLRNRRIIRSLEKFVGGRPFDTSAGNPVKEILLKLNLPDHRSILTDSKVTPTKDGGEGNQGRWQRWSGGLVRVVACVEAC
ncbi:hypothetical protein Tco_1112675 [Tanacetum coccineum]|uniref:Uncharacterized protein n=1 Tax=Tanacetum coccineum TaxID=301880 RepID=A0ABQ5IPZ7_9ASTR